MCLLGHPLPLHKQTTQSGFKLPKTVFREQKKKMDLLGED